MELKRSAGTVQAAALQLEQHEHWRWRSLLGP
jgi:hypothetical protein